ncbi:hypothetical protein C8D03_2685 [Bosea sp. 124]|nr:hypothetical protein C8D03_2685 [Bosea sp. 124]
MDPKKLDKLMTFTEVSEELGVPAFKFYRAAKRGPIPTYSIFNSRKYVCQRRSVSRPAWRSKTRPAMAPEDDKPRAPIGALGLSSRSFLISFR